MHTYFPYILAVRCLNLYTERGPEHQHRSGCFLTSHRNQVGTVHGQTLKWLVKSLLPCSQITDLAYVPFAEKACSGRARHHVDAHMISYYWQGLPMGTCYS